MKNNNQDKVRAIKRLKIISGQINGLEKMVEKDKYCIDILHQSLAIKEAISSFENYILEGHLHKHVVSQIKSGQSDKAIKEILSIYKLSKRK